MTAKRALRYRYAAGLVCAGLGVEILSLRWAHPTSFLVFLLGGAALVALGVAAYVWARLTPETGV